MIMNRLRTASPDRAKGMMMLGRPGSGLRRGQWTWTRKLIDMYEYAKRVEGVSLVSCTSHEA